MSAPEQPGQPEQPDTPAPSGPRRDARATFRGPYSATLTLELIAVPFSLLVMGKVEGGLTPLKVIWVVVLELGLVAAIPLFSRPWGLGLALGLQVFMLLGWLISPSLGVLGVVFCLLWAFLLYLRREVIRRQAAWPTA